MTVTLGVTAPEKVRHVNIKENIMWLEAQSKLDGVGPVDNRPSTD